MATPSPLEERMCCGVCCETYDNERHKPKLLPCQHTFCEVCIIRTTDQHLEPPSIICPVCRCNHVIPPDGFVTVRAVLDIVEEFANISLQVCEEDTTVKTASILMCPQHVDKEAAYVCIDCLDTFCTTCATASIHIQEEHHVEEVDEAAPALQQKFNARRRSCQKKLSLLDKSPCSSTELAEAEDDINSMSDKLCDEIIQWKNKQLSMVRENKSFVDAKEKDMRNELNSTVNDLRSWLHMIQQSHHDNDEDFMNTLHQRQAEGKSRFDSSRGALFNQLRLELESNTEIRSRFLKQVVTMPSGGQQSVRSVANETEHEFQAATRMQVAQSQVPSMPTQVTYSKGTSAPTQMTQRKVPSPSTQMTQSRAPSTPTQMTKSKVSSTPMQMTQSKVPSTAKQVTQSKVPANARVLYRVKTMRPYECTRPGFMSCEAGEVIAVTEDKGGRNLRGIIEKTGEQGYFSKHGVEKIPFI